LVADPPVRARGGVRPGSRDGRQPHARQVGQCEVPFVDDAPDPASCVPARFAMSWLMSTPVSCLMTPWPSPRTDATFFVTADAPSVETTVMPWMLPIGSAAARTISG